MRSDDTIIKDAVEAFIPSASEGYNGMVEETVSFLKAREIQRTKRTFRLWTPIAAAAGVIAALMIASTAAFAARPALAAEVPGVNGLVYAAARQEKASEADCERIEELLKEAFRLLAARDYPAASRCFRKGCLSDSGNYLAAAYLDHLLMLGELHMEDASACELEISGVDAERKAFRCTAVVKLELASKDGNSQSEECIVELWENTSGLHIERISFASEDYLSYEETYKRVFGTTPGSLSDLDLIRIDNSILAYSGYLTFEESAHMRMERWNHMLSNLDYISADPNEEEVRYDIIQAEIEKANGEITPEEISAESIASRLIYRYWLGGKTGETSELSDIMERNEQTDLFFWDAQLEADRVSLGLLKPLVSVEERQAEIQEVIEDTDEILKARFYVYTEITDGVSQGVGEEIVLTLRKDGAGLTVIGFDREVGDGIYIYSLKPLAERYKAQGYSWQEAGSMAYEAIRAQLETEAEMYPAGD